VTLTELAEADGWGLNGHRGFELNKAQGGDWVLNAQLSALSSQLSAFGLFYVLADS
jgi:hypothetical protein